MGFIALLAGGYLVTHVVAGAASLAIATIWIVGLGGISYGILGLIRAFQGAGWGAGILGVVSIIFGIFILTNRLASALAVPWMFGFMAIFGGLIAIFGAFGLRSAQKAKKAAEVKAEVRAPVAPVATIASAAAVATDVSQAEEPVPAATRFESVPLEAAPVEAPAVAVGAAAVLAAAAEEPAEAFEEPGVVAEEAAAEVAEEASTVVEETGAVAEETAAEVAEEAGAVVEEAGVFADETRSTVVDEAGMVAAETGAGAAVTAAVAGDLFASDAGPAVEETGTAVEEAAVVEEAPEVNEKVGEVIEKLPVFEIPNVVEILEEQANFLKKEIEYVEGIGPAYGAKLKAVGINSPLDLLRKGATRKGRELIAEASGITITLVLKWVNHADLFRLKGIGSEYADLLEAAGVDTVVELAQRNPVNLHNKMVATNEEKKLVRQMPSETQVEGWVNEAKTLDRVITY